MLLICNLIWETFIYFSQNIRLWDIKGKQQYFMNCPNKKWQYFGGKGAHDHTFCGLGMFWGASLNSSSSSPGSESDASWKYCSLLVGHRRWAMIAYARKSALEVIPTQRKKKHFLLNYRSKSSSSNNKYFFINFMSKNRKR